MAATADASRIVIVPGLTLRVIEREGDPWFVAKDVCASLAYADTAEAVKRHVEPEDKSSVSLGLPGRSPLIINESGLSLRVIEIDGDPWFIAKDVCDILGTRTDNIKAILDADEIKPLPNSGLRGRAPLTVSEPGLYGLVFASRTPQAKDFQKWVRATVLPAIRRDGAYVMAGPSQ